MIGSMLVRLFIDPVFIVMCNIMYFAFDDIALTYDTQEAENPILQWMRRRVHQAALAAFAGRQRLIEIGSGTGTDAVFFAQHGFEVLGLEPSSEMLLIAREKAAAADCAHRVSFVQAAAEELRHVAPVGLYDGLFSNFGALNCVAHLDKFAQHAARALKFGAPVLFVYMPPICPWEIGYHLLHGQVRKAFRRKKDDAGTLVSLARHAIRTYYFSPAQIISCFEPQFILERQFSLGLLAPPPYVSKRSARLLHKVMASEEKIAEQWPFRNFGDHLVFQFRRL